MFATESLLVCAAHMSEGDDAPSAILAIGVPHYTLRVTAICVERRNLGVVAEYALRAIACGFDVADDIADFLGIPHEEVESEVASLHEELFLAEDKHTGKLILMEKGRIVISYEGLRRAVVRDVRCMVDGVTRKAVMREPASLASRKRLPNGTLVLPSVPARPPRSGELNLADVKSSMANSLLGTGRGLEISRLGRIVRSSVLFQSGHVILRRGIHSVPTFCVDGAVNAQLAQHLGAHAGLQALKQQLDRQEKKVRHQLTNLHPKLRGQGVGPPQFFLDATARFVAWCKAGEDTYSVTEREFRAAAKALASQSHWAGGDEWHMLLRYAAVSAERRLLLIAPSGAGLIGRDVVEALKAASARGVKVELHVSPIDMQSIQRDEELRTALQHVHVVTMPSDGSWCGLCCDDAFAFVGSRVSITCTMGKTEVFFGSVLSKDGGAEVLLRSLAITGVPVTVKRSKRSAQIVPKEGAR